MGVENDRIQMVGEDGILSIKTATHNYFIVKKKYRLHSNRRIKDEYIFFKKGSKMLWKFIQWDFTFWENCCWDAI